MRASRARTGGRQSLRQAAPGLALGVAVLVVASLFSLREEPGDQKAPVIAAPDDGRFPGPFDTGVPAGAVLQPSGSIVTTHDGQVIDSLDVVGSIQVRHDGVTIRRTRIRQPGGTAIGINGNTGLVVEDCELDGTGNPTAASAIAEHNYTMRRCDVHHFGEGPRVNGNVTIEDNWFHDFTDFVSTGAHQDAIQVTSGSDIVIRGNTLDMNVDGANGAIYTCCHGGRGLLIEGNLVAGGLFAITGGGGIYADTRIIGNRISTRHYARGGYYGPLAYADGDTMSGNVWHETGVALRVGGQGPEATAAGSAPAPSAAPTAGRSVER